MDSPLPAPATASSTPRSFVTALALFVVLAMVPTVWTSLDLLAAGLFTGPAPAIAASRWWWVELINLYVPLVFRVLLGLTFALWLAATWGRRLKHWRLPLAFFVVAGILGPGAVVNLVFKDNWQRARPYQVENFGGTQKFTRAAVITDQCDNNCSFVSGHVACGVFLISLGLVHRRRRIAWLVAGAGAGLAIAFARMSDKAHWLSDVLWAFPITLTTSWLVWKALVWAYNKPSRTVG
jgi:lipid A 4'-phosphatase